jgi:multidrug efflux pump subunit AcrB
MGAWVIVFDPIFSGLAWSFVFGIVASTCFTLLVVPVAYALTRKEGAPPVTALVQTAE